MNSEIDGTEPDPRCAGCRKPEFVCRERTAVSTPGEALREILFDLPLRSDFTSEVLVRIREGDAAGMDQP